MILKNFQTYKPVLNDFNKHIINMTNYFLISSCGKDWYECQSDFNNTDLIIMYNAENVVLSAGYDVSSFYPEKCSIAQIKYDGDINKLFGKVFNEETMTFSDYEYSPEQIDVMVQKRKKKLLNDVMIELQPLQFAEQMGDISTEELEFSTALKKYALDISRLKSPDCFYDETQWPEYPVKKS